MTATSQFESLARDLVGLPISSVWRGHGSAIFIEFGELVPTTRRDGSPGQPEGRISLGVEWSWRIEDARSILCGSWSDEELWEPAFDRLLGLPVARCELFGALPEVVVTTAQGLRIVTFSTTDGQPRWYFVDRRHAAERWFSVRDGQLHLGDGSELAV